MVRSQIYHHVCCFNQRFSWWKSSCFMEKNMEKGVWLARSKPDVPAFCMVSVLASTKVESYLATELSMIGGQWASVPDVCLKHVAYFQNGNLKTTIVWEIEDQASKIIGFLWVFPSCSNQKCIEMRVFPWFPMIFLGIFQHVRMISHDFRTNVPRKRSNFSGTRQPRSRHPSRSGWDLIPTSKLHPPGSFVTKGGDMSWEFFLGWENPGINGINGN